MRTGGCTWKRWLSRRPESRPGPRGTRACAAWSTTAPAFDMESYKDRFIERRVAIRVRATHHERLGDYLKYLAREPGEMDRLLRCLTIHVSSFFRNAEHLRGDPSRGVSPDLRPGRHAAPALLERRLLARGGTLQPGDARARAPRRGASRLGRPDPGHRHRRPRPGRGQGRRVRLAPGRRSRSGAARAVFRPRGALAPRAGDPPDGALSPGRHPDGAARRGVRSHPLPQPADLPRPPGPGGGARALCALSAAGRFSRARQDRGLCRRGPGGLRGRGPARTHLPPASRERTGSRACEAFAPHAAHGGNV